MGVLLIYAIILTFVNYSDGFFLSTNKLPCEYEDSMNITDGTALPDGSILHNGIKYTKQQFDTVNYRLMNNVKRIKVAAHLRGCPCNVKPCLRLCCPLGSFVNTSGLQRGTILQEIPCYHNAAAKNYQSEVFDENTNQSQIQILDKHFSYAVLLRLTKFYKPKNYHITNNGHIKYWNGKGEVTTLTHRNYCLRADLNRTTQTIEMGVLAFFENVEELPTKYVLSAICMLISVFFIAATILVYIILPELHNLHGSCLVCHLAGLIVAYSLTAWVKLNGWHYVDSNLCYLRGHLMYFALLSAFLWSNVICYDLWRNFRATLKLRQFSDKHQFRFYMVYGWGLAAILTLFMPVLNYTHPFPNYLLPEVDINTCFLQKESLLLYFYAPLFIIFSINIICFVSTTLKICQIQRDLIKMTSNEESARHQCDLNNGKDDLTLYVRLFVITGVTWILEIFSFVISPDSNGFFFLIIDIWNALQGLIIFVSYTMKRRVLILLHKRYQDICGKVTARESFTLHSSSSSKSTNLRLSLSSCEKSRYKEVR